MNSCSVCSLSRKVDICRHKHPSYMISRAISADISKVADGEPDRNGPLMEYERRISAGGLSDGDACQLGTLRELQRLYDELVVNSESCRLDGHPTSGKTGRSRWLLSRFIPQTSYAAVRGLYLYGGVGTGKTMLMDLFFDQLPCNWRTKRIHFHDFMLNVHSRVQAMYEKRARLLCTAEGTPIELFDRIVTIAYAKQMALETSSRSTKPDLQDICVDNELGFAKDRTISRLTEMNSREYLEQHAQVLAGKQARVARKSR